MKLAELHEAKAELSAAEKKERDIKNVGRFSHDQAIANGESEDKAREIAKKAMATRRKNLS